MIGSRLSHFEVTAKLGEGGMGEVYRARDTSLDREVAIKILPSDFVDDPERLARFEREAKLLASLSHPHIASVYEVGEEGGVHFLAMELIEGEDLSQRLSHGPLPVDEAISIALQIAEGLEAAHQRGIVHRDLKPGNVVADSWAQSVKLLDFGLAKSSEPSAPEDRDLTRSPTLTAGMTRVGVILGTASYMSPEQARGREVDRRTDVFAFGCILFEMLSGKRAFPGDDVAEILARVIQGDPDWDALPEAVPLRVRGLIERCLRKDPRHRLRDVGDAWVELQEVASGVGAGSEMVVETPPRRSWPRVVPWVLAGALAVALAFAVWLRESPRPESKVRRFAVDLPWDSVPNWTDFEVAISPTGDHIAYNGRVGNRVEAYVRSFAELEGRPVAPARETTWFAFSPDGAWLAIQNGPELLKAPLRGGPPTPLATLLGLGGRGRGRLVLDAYGISWGERGDILVASGSTGSGRAATGGEGSAQVAATSSGILRIPAAGGELEQVTRVEDGEDLHTDPRHLPGGRHALFTVYPEDGPPGISVVDLETGERTPLSLVGSRAVYARSGHLVFLRRDAAMAVPFDLDSLTVRGEAVLVVENVRRGPFLANDGTMVYVPERGDSSARLVWADRSGRATPVDDDRRDYSHLDLAGNGRRALVNVGSDVYEVDLVSGARQKLASEANFPIFTPDDGRATTFRFPERIFVQAADGSGEAEVLLDAERMVVSGEDARRPLGTLVPTSWNPRTGELAFFDDLSDLWILDPDGEARPFLDSDANERTGRFSPDGRWLAYVSNETGEYEVYVVAYPDAGRKVAVSIGGGLSPIWSPDGRELFFRLGGKLLSSAVSYEPELSFAAPVEVLDGPYTLDLMGHQRWDVASDGERFLMVENSADFRIVVVEGFLEELERLAPTRGR